MQEVRELLATVEELSQEQLGETLKVHQALVPVQMLYCLSCLTFI
jgi:hypothetical protein